MARMPMMSARVRIIGWMVGVITLALTGSVLVTWEVLGVRLDALVDAELSHEANRFRTFAGSPAAGASPGADELLTAWLQDHLPDNYEAFFSTVDGQPHRRSQGDPPARLDTDPAFVAMVAAATSPQYGWVETSAGQVRYGVLPVRVAGDTQRATYVILEYRDVLAKPIQDAARVFTVAAFAALLVAAAASWLVAGRVLAPIRQVRATAERIGETDLRQRITVVGNDDVAHLARTFNHMLERLEVAFSTQRQFLDDAGHELRTPITVIRGHLELMGDDPDDRRETTALVVDELERMNRIVNELLVLARAERPDFLTPGLVNLTDLVVDVVAKARPLADRRWAVDAVADATVQADGQRLTQALMQLVANAVQHTKDGDRIAVGSEVGDGQIRLWVSDTGHGVSSEDRTRIFERFARGSARQRIDGSGLGLAIVRSIAQAHGGDVRLTDDPGNGATFVLDLPLSPSDVDAADVGVGSMVP